jgi:adenylosuccinate lyase
MLHILEHLRGNLWLYINREYLVQLAISTEIGSSTMPNKVNPIDIENAKTAIEMAKRMIDGICDILSETSYQRDVSDSSALRNFSSVAGYVMIVLRKLSAGVSRLSPNVEKIYQELEQHPEVILEGIQTYLKLHCNMPDAYEKMKIISRGRKGITLQDIHTVINNLDILEEHKIKLKQLTPNNYIG